MVLYRCPKVYGRTLTALRPSPQPSSSGRLSFRASEDEKIVREGAEEVVDMQEDIDQRGRYRGDGQGGLAGSWFLGEAVCELGAELESESTAITPSIVANEVQQPDNHHGTIPCSRDLRRENGPASSQWHGPLISSVPERTRWDRSIVGCYDATDNRLSHCSQHKSETRVEVPEIGPASFTSAYDEGAVEIEVTPPRSPPLCELAGIPVGVLQAKLAPAAMALAEEVHAGKDDRVFSDSDPVMQSTLGSAEEAAELENGEARPDVGYGEAAAWLGTVDDISESDALTWTEDTCACLVEVMGRMQAERSPNDQWSYQEPSNGPIATESGTINTEEMHRPAGVEKQQGLVNSIVDAQVSSVVSALVGLSTASPSISRRASTIQPDSIAEGEALAEEHEKYVPYRLSMPRSSSAELPTYTCYSPPLHRPARRTASSRRSFGKRTSSATAPDGLRISPKYE